MNMNILIFDGFNNRLHQIHYVAVTEPIMNNESEKDKAKEYNLKGIQVHRSCSRLLLDSPNKFDTSSIDDVPIKKLFVTNLAKKTTQEDLSKFFSTIGKVEECIIKKNKKSNYAFVTFASVEDALKALKSTSRLHEKELTVIPADSRHQPTYTKKEKKVANEPKEKIEQPSSSSTSTEVYPLVHRISDNCLMNIFQHLPIVDRVRVEGVCRRWRDLSQDSWRTMRRLDVNSLSWGCKSIDIGTSDLYQVLKRCGRFITMITFFEQNRMMSLRTLFIIGKLCPHLKIAYLGTLEVTPREIFFLLSQCPNLEFLELDSYHFSDRDFSEIFTKSKKLRYVSFEESKIDGSCFISLPEMTETIVFHEPIRGVNHIIFHSAIERLKNLQNLYLSVSHNDGADMNFMDDEMGIPVFDDVHGNDMDLERAIYDEYDDDNHEMDPNDSSDEEDEKVFQDILMMINETDENNAGNNSQGDAGENVGWGPKPQTSAKKDEDPSLENQSEQKEDSSAKKEYVSWCSIEPSQNGSDEYDLFIADKSEPQDDDLSDKSEGQNDYDEFESEEDFNDISSTITDVPAEKDNRLASTSKLEEEANLEKTDNTSTTKTSECKTSDSKISDAKTDYKISDAKASDTNDNRKPSNERKEKIFGTKSMKGRVDSTLSDSSNDFSRNQEFDSSSTDSYNDAKAKKGDGQKDKESDSNGEVGTEKEEAESKDSKEKVKLAYNFDDDDVDDDLDYEYRVPDDDEDELCNAYDDFFDDDYDNYDDYDDYEDYDDEDGFDVENDFEYESNLANTIRETIRSCNKNLKILQLKRCNPTGLTSEDLITNLTNFTSLERLDLSKMRIVNDDLLSAVGANCPKLSVLVINGCDAVTDVGIGGIVLLPELKHLSMSDIPQVTGNQLETVHSLKTLYCARCASLQEESLTQLILNSHELEQLDIQMCKFVSNSLVNVAQVATQSRTNSIKLKIFAKGSSIDASKIEGESELLEILMERRCEERDSFVDGDLGTEETGLSGDLRYRDFRGIIFESSTTEKDKED